jgi:hypothetical protein
MATIYFKRAGIIRRMAVNANTVRRWRRWGRRLFTL